MKVTQLMKLVKAKNVDVNTHYEFLKDLIDASRELGFKNNVDQIFDNIGEIFLYIASNISRNKIASYEKCCNNIAQWIHKDISISYDELMATPSETFTYDSQDDDTSDLDQAVEEETCHACQCTDAHIIELINKTINSRDLVNHSDFSNVVTCCTILSIHMIIVSLRYLFYLYR